MRIGERIPAFAHAEFVRFWSGAVVSNTGSMMYLAALGWITAGVTDSAAAIAAVPFVGLIPLLLVSPFAGAWADRWSRRKMLLAALAAQATVGVAVAIMVTADQVTYPRLIVASIIGGISGSAGAPVYQAIMPTLVPIQALRSAVVLNSLQFNISRAVGPTLAGFLIDATGAATVFWLNAASFLAVIVAIWSLEERPVPERTGERSVVGDIVAGARYAAGDRPIRVALTAGGVNALLIFPISYVAPVLATQALDLDAAEYGVLVGSFGLGAILAGIQMLLSRDRPYERIVSVGVGGCSIGLLVIGLAPGLLVALVGMFVTGAAFINITTNVLSSLQIQLDDRVRGRVMSLWMMIYGSLGPLGIIVFGAAGDIVDIQTVFVVAAALMASYLTFMTVRRGFAVLDPPPEALAADTSSR